MGEISKDIQEGVICQVCGCWMPDVLEDDSIDLAYEPPGHPRTCSDCIEDSNRKQELPEGDL